MKIAISGTGYVGLVTAVALSQIKHNVTCVDIDENKIKKMQQGISPIYEKDLEELMQENKERLTYTTDYKMAYSNADVIFIGVGTPEKIDGSANLDYVYTVAKQISESITKDMVVVIKSTVPIGTNDEIEKYINDNTKYNVYLVSNPEFLAQGSAMHDTLYASRIVVGTENDYAKDIMKKLYEPLTKEPYNVPYLSMNRRSAEMVKYASNDFLALKISYINEIANFCEKVGADIELVTQGMGYDKRIGNNFLKAGIGYGGSCFPKDTKALHWLSIAKDSELKTIKACIEVNKEQKLKLYKKLKEEYNLKNKTIAVLGLSFKPGTDDLREAPSIDNIKALLDDGASINAYDPVAINNFKKIVDSNKIKYYTDMDACIKDVDIVMILTEWDSIKNIDLNKFNNKVVFDGRNCYSLEEIKKYSFKYISIGR